MNTSLTSDQPGIDPKAKIAFEGMQLTKAEIDKIKNVRTQARVIKEGIDTEHVLSLHQMAENFQNAANRANRELALAKANTRL